MYYRNGREVKSGDKVVQMDSCGKIVASGNTIAIGFGLTDGIHIFTAKNFKEDVYKEF